MIGLIFLFIIGIWILICITITAWTAKKINFKNQILKVFYVMFMFSFLFVAPLGDEIVAIPKYKALCQKYKDVTLLKPDVKNTTVYIESRYTTFEKEFFDMFSIQKVYYADVLTKQPIGYHVYVYPEGGILNKITRLNGEDSFLFKVCRTNYIGTIFKDRNITKAQSNTIIKDN